MFTTILARIFLTGVLIFSCGTMAFAQDPDKEILQAKENAVKDFENGDYEFALPVFKRLMSKEPGNALYSYYTGVCLVQLDTDLSKAVELLQYASSRNVPVDAYLYLGEAYRKQYDFKQAKKSYLKFDREAPRSLAKQNNSKLYVRSSDRALEITDAYNPVELLNVSYIDFNTPEHYEQIKGRGGVLTRKPVALQSENEDQEDLNTLMFMPERISRGQFVYFSGIQGMGSDGYQIMQARRGKTGKWTDIKPVEDLNTENNEILPYFDPVGMDMYFASDGYAGLGGFDLYRSHYNEEKKEWSKPENIGFPLNSVYDDYILIPGADLGMLTIVTGRQIRDTMVAAYRLHVIEPRQSLASASPDEISRVANLGLVLVDAEPELIAEYNTKKEAVSEPDVLPSKKIVEEKNKEEKPVTIIHMEEEPSGVKEKNKAEDKATEYRNMITSALSHQSKADSLAELSAKAAVMVRKLDDPDDRWVYQKNIMVWNKRADEQRHMADSIFSHISEYEIAAQPSTIEKDTVINDMIVYKHKPAADISEKARQAFGGNFTNEDMNSGPADNAIIPVPSTFPDANKISEKNTVGDVRFQIFDQSPYSIENPVEEVAVPDAGASYRVQLAVLSKPAETSQFGGVFPLGYELVADRNLYRYYAGSFTNYADAEAALTQIRESGYSDAYIVAWYNGDKMSSEKVRKLEK